MMPDLVQSLLNTLNQIIEDNPIIAVAFSGFAIAIFGALIALFRHIRMGGRRNAVASNSGSDHFSDDTTKGITSVSIGDIEGGIQNSTIAGRDIIQTNVTFPSTSNSLQKRQLNAL
jgi:hypothetical protein